MPEARMYWNSMFYEPRNSIFAHESLGKAFGTCNLKSSSTLGKVLT